MDVAARVRLPLLLLRIGVFIVMLMWTLDKLVRPGHAAGVFKKFYQLDLGGPAAFYVLAALELVLLLLFVTGTAKRWSYGAVLVLHAISTVSAYKQYLQAFDNLLFFAAWPMLAACIALYLLRDLDTLWAVQRAPRLQEVAVR
jgi:putative oxidoreductase